MQQKLLTISFCFIVFASAAQDQFRLLGYNEAIIGAITNDQKIDAYTQLADYYSLFKLNNQADSVSQKAFSIAELLNDDDLILKSLFSNNVANINPWNSTETFEKIIKYINKGLAYAQDQKREDYVGLAFIRLSSIYRKRKLFDQALQFASQSFTALNSIDADSIKCILYVELGDIFIAKGDIVPAYKNYNKAFEIAYKIKNKSLQSEIYHHYSELYKSLGDDEEAKKNLKESEGLNLKDHNKLGLLKDYLDLARLTDDTVYIARIKLLADEIDSDRYKEYAKRLKFTWYMVNEKNANHALIYFYNNPSLSQYYRNQGPANYYWNLGNIYFYGEKFDSALYYYRLAENELTQNYDNGIKLSIYKSLAETYEQNHNNSKAIIYFEKAFTLSQVMNSMTTIPLISNSLSRLYADQSNFKLAYYYDTKADSCNKLLAEKISKDKVVLLQVERENTKHENDLKEIERKKDRTYNLQLMAITVLIAIVFAIMLFLGMFKVSKFTIKTFGYFAFISLFEFIIVLVDPLILEFTHDKPLYIWGIKILLIGLLVPLQNYLEHTLVKFLSSRKLLEARNHFSIKKWWQFKKESIAKMDEGTD